MTSASELIRAAPKYLGQPYAKMDCQAFVERCLSDVGIDMNLAGSNAWYRKMTWTGTPDECRKKYGTIPKGAFLFILKQDGKEPEKYKPDGIGNASHIGIYTGLTGAEMCDMAIGYGILDADLYNHGNGAIHSSSGRGVVCTSAFQGKAISGGWNRIGIWDRIDYGLTENEGSETRMTATVYAPSGATVNIRKDPDSKSALVDRVPVGAEVEITEETADWAKVEYQGKRGWMMKAYLKTGAPQTPDGTVAVDRAWLEGVYKTIGEILK